MRWQTATHRESETRDYPERSQHRVLAPGWGILAVPTPVFPQVPSVPQPAITHTHSHTRAHTQSVHNALVIAMLLSL